MYTGNTPASALRNAALVVEYGWTRGSYIQPVTGDVCAMGAIILGSGASKLVTDERGLFGAQDILQPSTEWADIVTATEQVLRADLLEHNPNAYISVTGWNDEHAADATVVAATMRRAADRWEQEHQPALVAQADLALASGPSK